MTWKEKALEWIRFEGSNHPELSREKLREHCSQNYPFGQRKNHPYKAFLAAMRQAFGDKNKQRQAKKAGQQALF